MARAEIRARASLETSAFDRGIKSMQTQAARLKGVIAGAFTVGAIGRFATSAMNAGDEIVTLADTFGITTDELQALTKAGMDNNASTEQMTGLLGKLQSALIDGVADPAGAAAKSLEAIGLAGDSLKSANVVTVVEQIGRVLADADSSAQSLAASADLVGANGFSRLAPFLKTVGETGIKRIVELYRDGGRIIDEESLLALQKAEGRLKEEKDRIATAAFNMAGGGVSMFTEDETKARKQEAERLRAARASANEQAATSADMQEADKIREETAKKLADYEYDQLSASEKIMVVWEKIKNLRESLDITRWQTDQAKIEAQMADLELQRRELLKQDAEDNQKKMEDAAASARYDSLRRIGGNIIGSNPGQQDTSKRLLKTADLQLAELQAIRRGTTQGARF